MEKRLRARHAILFIPLVLAIVVFGAFSAAADHADPVLQSGNPVCPAGTNELKVDPVADGEYDDDDTAPGPLEVTVTVDEGAQEFDWSSNIGVDVVIVKGGPNANVYTYSPESSGDTDLHAPLNEDGSGVWYGLSHISFCYDVESPPPSPSPSVSPTETETPGTSPSPSVAPTETETPPGPTPSEPGTTVLPSTVVTSVATSPSVLGTKVLSNTGADVRNLIYLALALIAMGLLAYTVARRSTKSN